MSTYGGQRGQGASPAPAMPRKAQAMKTDFAPSALETLREIALANPVAAFVALVVITALWATWATRNL